MSVIGSNVLAGSAGAGGGAYSGDIAVAHSLSPYVAAYSWDSGFGTKHSNPSTLPPNACFGIAFSPDGNYLAVATEDSHSHASNLAVGSEIDREWSVFGGIFTATAHPVDTKSFLAPAIILVPVCFDSLSPVDWERLDVAEGVSHE